MYFLPRHKPPTRHSGTVNVLNSAVCVFVHVIAMGLATLTHTSKPSDYYNHIHLRAYIFFFLLFRHKPLPRHIRNAQFLMVLV